MYLICYIVYKGDIITCKYTYKTNNIHRSVIIRLCKLLVVSSSGPGLLLLAARLLAEVEYLAGQLVHPAREGGGGLGPALYGGQVGPGGLQGGHGGGEHLVLGTGARS